MECTHCKGSCRDEYGECWECNGKGYTIPSVPRLTIVADNRKVKDVRRMDNVTVTTMEVDDD